MATKDDRTIDPDTDDYLTQINLQAAEAGAAATEAGQPKGRDSKSTAST
jgi:hypothetical protein